MSLKVPNKSGFQACALRCSELDRFKLASEVKIEGVWVPYGLATDKSKSPQTRYGNMGTVLSYPNKCSGLTTEFLVCVSRTCIFSYLVRQGESDDDSSPGVLVPVVNVNRYANVETAMYPFSHFSKPAYLRTSQAQMVRNCILLSLR
jgi:hypothetical protein